jgi:hypothetical protein
MSRRGLLIGTLALATVLGASCRKGEQRPAPVAGAGQQPATAAQGQGQMPEQRARQAIKALGGALKKELMQAMARGPDRAIDVCRVKAPQIARQLSTGGLEIGRTSHRLRNPNNTPRPWVRPLLDAMREVKPEPGSVRTVELRGGKALGVVQPIFTQPLCLTCHGKQLAPPIAAAIKRAYPGDRATGFAAGDLRGLFWVEVQR